MYNLYLYSAIIAGFFLACDTIIDLNRDRKKRYTISYVPLIRYKDIVARILIALAPIINTIYASGRLIVFVLETSGNTFRGLGKILDKPVISKFQHYD